MPFADGLEKWRRQDTRLWERETHIRQHVIDWRTDMFRNVAALLCDQNSIIAIEEPYVAKTIRKHETSTIADDATRSPSVLAAPASLTLALKSAASARGSVVTTQPAKGITITHASCGHINEPGSGAKSFLIKCGGCDETYDQDHNAAWLLLQRLIESGI